MSADYLGAVLDDEIGEYLEGEYFPVEGDDSYLGAADYLGARRVFRPRLRRAGPGLVRRAMPRFPANPAQRLAARAAGGVPGVPQPGQRRLPLGFPTRVFTATSGTALTAVTRPQVPMIGARLLVVVTRAGASATGAVTIADLKIGTASQLASADPLPAEGFAPGAFGVTLDLDPAVPGIDITLFLNISAAPVMTDTVTVSSMLINPSVA